jgi:hypothetical protein
VSRRTNQWKTENDIPTLEWPPQSPDLNIIENVWIVIKSSNLSPIRRGFAPGFVNYKKRCNRLATASEKDYQLLAHGRWFSPGTPSSSTTKPGRHDIAEILLKVALNTKNKNQSSSYE